MNDAVSLFNEYSPQFVGSLVSDDAAEQAAFYDALNAPFVGNDMTRWVDGAICSQKTRTRTLQLGGRAFIRSRFDFEWRQCFYRADPLCKGVVSGSLYHA